MTTPVVDAALRETLRAQASELAFCCAHIVAEDGNLLDEDIRFVLDEAGGGFVGKWPDETWIAAPCCDRCREFGEALLALPLALRYQVLGVRPPPDG